MMSSSRIRNRRQLPSLWESRRGLIVKLYQEELKPLYEIVSFLEQEYGFNVTETALKMKLSRWKVRRSAPHALLTIGDDLASEEGSQAQNTRMLTEIGQPELHEHSNGCDDNSGNWVSNHPLRSLTISDHYSPNSSRPSDASPESGRRRSNTPPELPAFSKYARLQELQYHCQGLNATSVDHLRQQLDKATELSSKLVIQEKILGLALSVHGRNVEPLFPFARDYCLLAAQISGLQDFLFDAPSLFEKMIDFRAQRRDLRYSTRINLLEDVETATILFTRGLFNIDQFHALLAAMHKQIAFDDDYFNIGLEAYHCWATNREHGWTPGSADKKDNKSAIFSDLFVKSVRKFQVLAVSNPTASIHGKGFRVFTLLSEIPWPSLDQPILAAYFSSPYIKARLKHLNAAQRKIVFDVIFKSMCISNRLYNGLLRSMYLLRLVLEVERDMSVNDGLDYRVLSRWCSAFCYNLCDCPTKPGRYQAVKILYEAFVMIPDSLFAEVDRGSLEQLKALWAEYEALAHPGRLDLSLRSALISKMERQIDVPTHQQLSGNEKDNLGQVQLLLDAAIEESYK